MRTIAAFHNVLCHPSHEERSIFDLSCQWRSDADSSSPMSCNTIEAFFRRSSYFELKDSGNTKPPLDQLLVASEFDVGTQVLRLCPAALSLANLAAPARSGS
ncbi:MAG: hypothetical protein M3R69_05185, partial [Acidobacteriota bacterium]|nr:hypothetical protein [Acidobacteriota bacterium]